MLRFQDIHTVRARARGLTLSRGRVCATALALALLLPPVGAKANVSAQANIDRNASGTWTALTNLPFARNHPPETALLMTDGTVVVHARCTGQWFRLTPDNKGKYETGTWSMLPWMPKGYTPLYFASEILPDGRLIMNGGEYNSGCSVDWTNLGAIYDPVADIWTAVPAPTGWTKIGDAPSIVLPNGSYMLADCCDDAQALATINGTTVTWTTTGSGKGDSNQEEGWTLLPDGNILTVDANRDLGVNPNDVEIYDTSTGTWSTVGTTAQQLVAEATREIGPGVLRPDGNLIYFGAVGHNDVYNTSAGTWMAGPDFPVINGLQYNCADAPAALLPSGNVLVQASPGQNNTHSHFFEFSITDTGVMKLSRVDDPGGARGTNSNNGRLLVLPTGQALWTDHATGAVATYTPRGAPDKAWLPKIKSVSTTLTIGSTGNVFSGKNFNGFSQGAMFGDDAQQSTNYPLVRITNNSTGDVCFGRSHGFSTMGVWTTGTTRAKFDIPDTCETGASTVQVVVNGLASAGVSVTLDDEPR